MLHALLFVILSLAETWPDHQLRGLEILSVSGIIALACRAGDFDSNPF